MASFSMSNSSGSAGSDARQRIISNGDGYHEEREKRKYFSGMVSPQLFDCLYLSMLRSHRARVYKNGHSESACCNVSNSCFRKGFKRWSERTYHKGFGERLGGTVLTWSILTDRIYLDYSDYMLMRRRTIS